MDLDRARYPEPRPGPRDPHGPALVRDASPKFLVQDETALLPPTDDDVIERLSGIEIYEHQVQSEWREKMFRDHRFADGHQYDIETLQALRERGQPVVTYNWIHTRLLWMTGTERRNRVDFIIEPKQDSDEAKQDAITKATLLKYLGDVNYEAHYKSAAAREAFTCGLSWLESGIRGDPEDEPIYGRHETWANVLHDSAAGEPLFDDMRYLIRKRQVDLDVSRAYFPKHADALANAAYGYSNQNRLDNWYLGVNLREHDWDFSHLMGTGTTSQFAWSRNPRQRVALRETWMYVPTRQRGKTSGGSTFDRVKMLLWLFIWCNDTLILKSKTPYKHNKIPFTPLRCFTEFDGCPKGIVRDLISPSEAFNKKQSRAVFASNSRMVLIESSAINNPTMPLSRIEDVVAKGNGTIVVNEGAVRDGRIKVESGQPLAAANVELARVDYDFINQGSGVNAENLGNQTNATSGVAIQGRQSEGQVTITEPFDNVHLAYRRHGELALSLIEQFYQAPRQIFVPGERGKAKHLEINTFDPDTGEYKNDLTRFNANFTMREAAWKASLAQSSMESLWGLLRELAPADPEIVTMAIDMLIEYSDLPTRAKDVLTERIRKSKGLEDPDGADDPEVQAARQQAQAAAEEAAQMQREQQAADTQETQAKAALTAAKAQSERANLAKDLMTTMRDAIQLALETGTVPDAAQAADQLLQAVGFPDQTPATPGVLS